MKQYVLDVAALSDRGVTRVHNEDAWSTPAADLTPGKIASKGRLFVVADGVGGHQAGNVASKMAVTIIQEHYYAHASPDAAAGLAAAIREANTQIDQEAAARPEQRGMSTTVTAVVLRGAELTVANVGDSRTYLIRNGRARQVTADHSWVEEQVRVGIITREEADKHPQRNIITRSLGTNRELEIDIFEEHLDQGDSVLLCTDGLTNTVTDTEIGTIVGRARKAKKAVNELIEQAKQRGAPDNVTAVLLGVRKRGRGCLGRLLITAAILGGLAMIAGALALGIWIKTTRSEKPTSAEQTVNLPSLGSSASVTPTPASSPLNASMTLTMVFSPLRAPLPPLELVWPAENTSLSAADPITFVWQWEHDPGEQDGHFIFALKAGEDTQPIVHEELPLNQRQFVISQRLEPGKYLWTLSASGTVANGSSAGRLFDVIEATPMAVEPPLPTPDRPY